MLFDGWGKELFWNSGLVILFRLVSWNIRTVKGKEKRYFTFDNIVS